MEERDSQREIIFISEYIEPCPELILNISILVINGFGRDVYFQVKDIFIVSNRFVIGPFQMDMYRFSVCPAKWTVAYNLILFGNKYFLIAVDISFKFETSLKMAETV